MNATHEAGALPRIFFYHGISDRLAAAAALLGKACMQGKAAVVYAPDAALAEALDRALWLQPPTAFIPHVRLPSPLASETPLLIADALDSVSEALNAAACERLMNLSSSIPPGFERFPHLIEVVSNEDAVRLPARERFKFYKTKGCEVESFDWSGKF
ncbi:MAG: DNA polymerase III subunit chi [Betaproteobacteria bacterium]|nr:DNA polymerase III subunit chi [Betaproteobacteria bacterium]